ncbi:MAG: class I SAM-dependent methyltransferase [Scytolyngbya sp. HA4215-MV1]|jgi:predicted O-methyltransferase YrrM|nr:class I SAM-dependent methyltransferase [Scytolyngbya sp. HA4215-MV1]
MKIGKQDSALVLGIFVILITVGGVGWKIIGEPIFIVLLALAIAILLVILLEIYRRLSEELRNIGQTQNSQITQYFQQLEVQQTQHFQQLELQQKRHFQQIESLFSIFSTLKLNLPLPYTGGWAASADLLKKLVELILLNQPDLVLEASSGVSTLVIAYCLKQVGKGKVVALEHDAKYVAVSQEMIQLHGLEDVATIVHAPLKEFSINDQPWLWYDTDCLKIDQSIDLFVIDGPPGSIQKCSRYPALPLLYSQLSHHAHVILDDGYRDDEQEIAALWDNEFAEISLEFLDLEKGAYLFHKKALRKQE